MISSTNTVSQAANRDYAVPTFMALSSSSPAPAASVGYAGTASDGLSQLDATHTLTAYDSAPDGHIVATEDVTPGHGGAVTLALGFGRTQASAVATAGASLASPVRPGRGEIPGRLGGVRQRAAQAAVAFPRPVRRDRRPICSAGTTCPPTCSRRARTRHIRAPSSASLASPWGQAVPAGTAVNGKPVYFGSYREVFSRDLYEAFTGLLTDGDLATARAATLFLFDHQQLANGQLPRNSLVNGAAAPDTGGTQLDETAYPILMALQSGLAVIPHCGSSTSGPQPTSWSRAGRRSARSDGRSSRVSRRRRSPRRSPG